MPPAAPPVPQSPNGVPEPPALIFILRLHVEHLIRRRLANPAAIHRRLPPPLDLDLGVFPRDRLDAAPEVLCCPISHGLMRVPVVGPSGTTFEYDCIRRWGHLPGRACICVRSTSCGVHTGHREVSPCPGG
jgi:hypothetical protein